jgi:hypothetical protein
VRDAGGLTPTRGYLLGLPRCGVTRTQQSDSGTIARVYRCKPVQSTCRAPLVMYRLVTLSQDLQVEDITL